MKRCLRVLAVYAPGIPLLIAGTVTTILFPVVQHSGTCSCPNGKTCTCPALTETYDPLGPVLLITGGIYSLIVFAVRAARHARRTLPPWGPQQA